MYGTRSSFIIRRNAGSFSAPSSMVRKTTFRSVGTVVNTGGRPSRRWPSTSKPSRVVILGFFAGGGGAVSGTRFSPQCRAAATRAVCAARSLVA
ncbi:hypothetical protein RKD26_002585 [Streptomyces calvus]